MVEGDAGSGRDGLCANNVQQFCVEAIFPKAASPWGNI